MIAMLSLFLFCACLLTHDVISEKQSTVLTIYTPHSPGDIVGKFELRERLDILGVEKTYMRDYESSLEMLDDADDTRRCIGTGSDVEEEHHHDLCKVKEMRVNESDNDVKNGQFYLNRKIFFGGHGEIWLGRKVLENGNVDLENSFVLKRMHIKDRPDILRCALREIYFGEHFRDNLRVAKYLTHFRIEDDYWLVFQDEGVSLQSLLYAHSVNKGNVWLEPSAIWRNMRTTKRGEDSMRSILYQVISGASLCCAPASLSMSISSTMNTFLCQQPTNNVTTGVHNLHRRGIVHRYKTIICPSYAYS
jgi:hypothetical protein